MPQDTLYVINLPGQPPCPPAPYHVPVHLAYRISPDLHLLRSPNAAPLGGVMGLSGGDCPPCGDPDTLCRALLRECAARQFRGLLLDADAPSPDLAQAAHLLGKHLPKQGISLFLPECLAQSAPLCRVLIPSTLSGGSLELRLTQAVEHYGADRVVLALDRAAEDFTLPAPSGCGQPLTTGELEALRREINPVVHFSAPLCTRYFTYFRPPNAHLVLCDDDDCLRRKTVLARRCGIFRFLLLQRDKSAVSSVFHHNKAPKSF